MQNHEFNKKINYIDLFAGAGGLSEGFIREGYYPIAHVEKNKDACLTITTRIAYHYLREQNLINEIYNPYLRNEINREELYSNIPQCLLNTVINQEITTESLRSIFSRIDTNLELLLDKKVDLIIGGPPCQAYSIAGRVAIVNDKEKLNDPRRFLYRQYIKFLIKYEPKLFVFENVPGILSAKDTEGHLFIDKMKSEFKEAGYEIDYKTLDATDYGVLQKRNRVFLIGWQENIPFEYPEFDKEVSNEWNVSRDILDDLPILNAGEIWEDFKYKTEPSEYLKKYHLRNGNDVLTLHRTRPNNSNDLEIYKLAVEKWYDENKRLLYRDLPEDYKTYRNLSQKGFQNRFCVVEGNMAYTHTMIAHIAQDGHYYIHPNKLNPRSISVREAARIQAFPDNFYFEGSRTSIFTQIGNAVPPLVAQAIARKIKEFL